MNYEGLDEAMLPFHDFMNNLTRFEGAVGENEVHGMSFLIERVQIETPFELQVQVSDEGKVLLGSTPPLYHVDTGIQPVFHHMKIRIEINQIAEPELYDESKYIVEP